MLDANVAPWPAFDEEQQEAVLAILRSGKVNYWTGEETRLFEKEFADFAGCDRAVAVANGTLALDLALKGLGIGPGDEVIVTPRTFIASVSCVVNAGATPVFADVERDSGNLSASTIASVLTGRTRAVIPVHLAGWPCDMEPILELAASHGVTVIEDCAQAHGASIDGRSVGSFGAAGAWSFCQDKIMSTGGEGGMVTTSDAALWDRMWSFKDHGKSYDAVYHRAHEPGFRWLHESIGTNWRMLEIQGAIGRIQLRKLAAWHARRLAIATHYREALSPLAHAIRVPWPREGMTHACYRFYAYIETAALKPGWNRDRIVAEVTRRGAPLFQGTCSEVYLEKAFDGTPWRPLQRLPTAVELGLTSLMFLTHPTLTEDDFERIADTVVEIITEAAA